MEKQLANTKISTLLETANKALAEAADIAREAGVDFSWSGPAYGMGGFFDPERTEDNWGNDSNGWCSSTESCS